MKLLVLTMGAVLFAGCGGASSGGTAAEDNEGQAQDPAAQGKDGNAETPLSTAAPVDITGPWENSSCGDRQYRRQITFQEGGKFAAVDEVAPCPPGTQCVWSGIVYWHGTWSLVDHTISLNSKPVEAGKMPEQLPEEFVVLAEQPLSIGEKYGEIICPYQKKK